MASKSKSSSQRVGATVHSLSIATRVVGVARARNATAVALSLRRALSTEFCLGVDSEATIVGWTVRAFTPVFDGLWARLRAVPTTRHRTSQMEDEELENGNGKVSP